MLTEFGGIAYDTRATGSRTWGYSRATDAESFLTQYTELLKAVSETTMFSGFCYTQFTDIFQETNGLLNADRSPKVALEAICEATRHGANLFPLPGV